MGGFVDKLDGEQVNKANATVSTRSAISAMNGTMCTNSYEEFTEMLKKFEPFGVEQECSSTWCAHARAKEMGQVLLKSHADLFEAAPKRKDYSVSEDFVAAVGSFLTSAVGRAFGDEIPIAGGPKLGAV